MGLHLATVAIVIVIGVVVGIRNFKATIDLTMDSSQLT